MKHLEPLPGKLIVVRQEQATKTPGGIELPDIALEKQQRGEVVACGVGRMLDNGRREVVDVQVGDVIFFMKRVGFEVEYNGEKLTILGYDEVLARITE